MGLECGSNKLSRWGSKVTEQSFFDEVRQHAEDDCPTEPLRSLYVELAVDDARERLEEAKFLAKLLERATHALSGVAATA